MNRSTCALLTINKAPLFGAHPATLTARLADPLRFGPGVPPGAYMVISSSQLFRFFTVYIQFTSLRLRPPSFFHSSALRAYASTDSRVHIPISLCTRQYSICLLLLLCLRSLLIFRLLLQDWIDPWLMTAHDQLSAFGCNFNHVKAVFLYAITLMCIVRHA